MLMNLLIGLSTMAVCLQLQTLLLVVAIRFYTRHLDQVACPSAWSTLRVLNSVMTILVVGNLVQVTLWALVFRLLGEFEELSTAIYHSGVNFATLGYGDIVMSEQHRLLGPMEAINGVLMIGVSTAALMATVQDAIKRTILARQQGDR